MAWAAVDPDGMLAVGCARSEYPLCEQVPGMNYGKHDALWRVPLSWPAWIALLAVWERQPIQVHRQLQEWANDQWEQVKERYRLRSALDADAGILSAIRYIESDGDHGQLRPPQRGGVQWLATAERCVLEDPMGNGKTPTVIRAVQLSRLDSTRRAPGAWLVIAAPSALYMWKREFGVWAPELSVQVIDGTAARRRKTVMDEGEADVYVIGWPTVRLHTRLEAYPGQAFVKCDDHGGSTGKTRAMCEVCEKELNEITWAGVIADEAHRMKDAKSKQTRAVWHLARGSRYFWAVTGTPVGDSIKDLWPVLHGIDRAAFPSQSRYLDLYAVKLMNWHGGAEFLGLRPETERAFHTVVQPLMRRIPKEVMRPGEPPRLGPEFRYPEMSPAQARAYRQLKKEAIADLESQTVVTPNDLAKFGRLCMLASASVEVRDGEDRDGFTKQVVTMALPSSKADDLMDFLEDNPGQLVACMNSPQLLELCEQKLAAAKITHCAIRGGMAPAQKDVSVRLFQEGECRVILLTAGSGGESVTLTASDTVLFLQPSPSFFVTDQVIGRVDRIGQRFPVRTVYSVTRGTVEERLYELSRDKSGRADQVTRDADLLRWMIGADEAVRA